MSVYRGRFAPSPTGLLHFGSLFAAVVSYLEARRHQGEWLIRIEDIDPLREQAHAKQAIIQSLEAHGLVSDQTIIFQSERSRVYESALRKLCTAKLAFRCPCSRKYLETHHGVHQLACQQQSTSDQACAIKFKSNTKSYIWQDEFQGRQAHTLNEDFVLKRKEGFYAYQLAVVCDDIEQNISHVIRGYDLLDSTPMQLALYEAFNKPAPTFGHFPVISSLAGQKLSKQNLAPALDDQAALSNLLAVLRAAGIQLKTRVSTCKQALDQATLSWNHRYLSAKSELIQA